MIDIFEESARLREAAKQRLDIPLIGTEWSAPQCAFFGAVVPGQTFRDVRCQRRDVHRCS